jgi:hypothetical protein
MTVYRERAYHLAAELSKQAAIPILNQVAISRTILRRIMVRLPNLGTEYQENILQSMFDATPIKLTIKENSADMPAISRK